MPLSAWADDNIALLSETPSTDAAPVRGGQDTPALSTSAPLAADPVNVMVVRHGRQESLTILRYNIEDIEEPAVRAQWEKIVRDLGFPKQGTFNGRSMDSLHKTSDSAEDI